MKINVANGFLFYTYNNSFIIETNHLMLSNILYAYVFNKLTYSKELLEPIEESIDLFPEDINKTYKIEYSISNINILIAEINNASVINSFEEYNEVITKFKETFNVVKDLLNH